MIAGIPEVILSPFLAPNIGRCTKLGERIFFGGSCTFAIRIVKNDESLLDSANPQFQKYYFDIKGKNPNDDRCKRFIKSVQGRHWYAWAVAKHESRWGNEVYNQFAPRDGIYGKKGEPFYTPLEGNGWGLFQRDPTGGGLPTTTQQVWDWTENVRGGITELDSKLAVATRYWSRLQKNYPTQYAECPPPSLVVEGNTLTAEDVITMTCYNGTGSLGAISNVLIFSPIKPCGVGAGKRWQWHLPNAPNSNKPYVNLVMGEYNGG